MVVGLSLDNEQISPPIDPLRQKPRGSGTSLVSPDWDLTSPALLNDDDYDGDRYFRHYAMTFTKRPDATIRYRQYKTLTLNVHTGLDTRRPDPVKGYEVKLVAVYVYGNIIVSKNQTGLYPSSHDHTGFKVKALG